MAQSKKWPNWKSQGTKTLNSQYPLKSMTSAKGHGGGDKLMKNVIANSQLHLRLEREGWCTVRVKGNVATLVRNRIHGGMRVY